jgi:fucose permease
VGFFVLIFAATSFLMIFIIAVIKLPQVELREDEKTGAWSTIKELSKQKTVILFFIGIFAYVGVNRNSKLDFGISF